mgnify:CR=1 FL=1
MPDNIVNPYQYMSAFATPYSTGQAYTDIGADVSEEFLSTKDPDTGLTYRDLIPEYDPYAEEEMRTEFRAGSKKAHQATVGEMAGITSQARLQRGASGFAGGGAGQAEMEQQRTGLERQYGQAFEGALLDLAGGIREERQTYQEQLASLLQSFGPDVWAKPAQTVYSLGEQFGDTDFYFPDSDIGGETIKAPDGNSYRLEGDTWVLVTGGTGGGGDTGGGGGTGGDTEVTGETGVTPAWTEYDVLPTQYTGEDVIMYQNTVYQWNENSEQYEAAEE